MRFTLWRSWRFWGLLLVGSTAVGLLEAAQVVAGASARGTSISWGRAAGSTMPSWYVMALLVPGIAWAANRFRLDGSHWRRALAAHLPLAVLFSAIHMAAASFISDILLYPSDWSTAFSVNLSRVFSMYFAIDVFTYFALLGAAYAFDYGSRYRENERVAAELAVRASRLETSLTRAKLEALRMQLNPHFLFNALNSVAVLALRGERHGVVRIITRLSDLLRLSLENSEQTIALRDELDFLDRYLEIEQVRFQDRLQVVREIEPTTLDAVVPSLILQPLVENALLHGIARQTGPGCLCIRTRRSGDRLVLAVTDNGPGFTADDLARTTADGVGLANTRARLDQLYGTRYHLELGNDDGGGACVTLSLPFRFVTDRRPRSAPEAAWRA